MSGFACDISVESTEGSETLSFKPIVNILPWHVGDGLVWNEANIAHVCPSVELAHIFCISKSLADTLCIVDIALDAHGHCVVVPHVCTWVDELMKRFLLDKQEASSAASAMSLAKILLCLDLCGAHGVLLNFPAVAGDCIADALYDEFTARDPLVDLRNDFVVLAAACSAPKRMHRFLDERTGGKFVLKNQQKAGPAQ